MNKKEFNELIKYEKKLYLGKFSKKKIFLLRFCKEEVYERWLFIYYLRKCEYYLNKTGILSKLMLIRFRRKKNLQGRKIRVEIYENCFGKGLLIHHGNIVVNSLVRAGENIVFHGSNCIGNNGKNEFVPVLEDNIEFGFGSVIIGNIKICSNIIIGANTFVNKDINESNSTYVGFKAKKL